MSRALTLIALFLLANGTPTLSSAVEGPGNSEAGFVTLFDGTDLSHWKIPEGDNGHWKVVGGVIDYDARSEAPGNKNLVSKEQYGDFVLKLDWRLKEASGINPSIPYILPDGTHARASDGKELKLALPDSDSGIYLRDPNGKSQVNIWLWPIGSGEVMATVWTRSSPGPSARP